MGVDAEADAAHACKLPVSKFANPADSGHALSLGVFCDVMKTCMIWEISCICFRF